MLNTLNSGLSAYVTSHYLTAEDLLWIGDANANGAVNSGDISAFEAYLTGHGGFGT
jgi:hypothetical protein